MSDRELLTECLDVLTHDAAQRTFAGGVRMSQLAIKLRAHLAAPEPESKTPATIDEMFDRMNKVPRNMFYGHDPMTIWMEAWRAAEWHHNIKEQPR